MKGKKTISVKGLIKRTNERNRLSTCAPGARHGWNALLADILHETDNYSGYGYWEEKDLPRDGARRLPGIMRGAGPDGEHLFPDRSRIFYYYSGALRP